MKGTPPIQLCFSSHNSRTGAFREPHLTLPAIRRITNGGLKISSLYIPTHASNFGNHLSHPFLLSENGGRGSGNRALLSLARARARRRAPWDGVRCPSDAGVPQGGRWMRRHRRRAGHGARSTWSGPKGPPVERQVPLHLPRPHQEGMSPLFSLILIRRSTM